MRQRSGEGTCVVHACAEGGCGRRRTEEGDALYCKSHECKATGCVFRRRRGEWCVEHVCARRGCERQAGAGGYCVGHQPCVVVGCENERAIRGDRVLERCENRG